MTFSTKDNRLDERKLISTAKGHFFNKGNKLEYLPGGVYRIAHCGENRADYFEPLNIAENKYFPLEKYNSSLAQADDDLEKFLANKKLFSSNDLPYKRSYLFFGEPGNGKTQYIINKSRELISRYDAIIIRCTSVDEVSDLISIENDLSQHLKGRLKVIHIEELAEFIQSSRILTSILNLLDSTSLRENTLFFLTTNYPDKIPANIINRPSRIDRLFNIHHKDNNYSFICDWFKFITGEEMETFELNGQWIEEATETLSVAYWAELYKLYMLHRLTLEEAFTMLKERKLLMRERFSDRDEIAGFNGKRLL